MSDLRLATIRRVLAAVADGDAERQVREYTDDVVVEFPFTDPPTRLEGLAAVTEMLGNAFQRFRIRLAARHVHVVDETTIVVEADGDGTYLPTGAPYANRYVIVFTFRGAQICGQREYFNPAAAAQVTDG